MALQRDARYPGRWTAASGGHPQGAFKNRTAPGALDGSYIEQDWANDWDGYFGSLLAAAGLTANGNVDAVGASQYYTAFRTLLNQSSSVVGVAANARMAITAASATATLTADEIAVKTALGGQLWVLPSFSKVINLGATGVGGMDTGAAPVNGYVALYAIYNPTTGTSALLAKNASAAIQTPTYTGINMPAGYTASALVSVLPTNGTSQFKICSQENRTVMIQEVQIFSGGSGGLSLSPISIAVAVPFNAVAVRGRMTNSSSASSNIGLTLNASTTSLGTQNISGTVVAGGALNGNYGMRIDTPQLLYVSTTNTAGTPAYTASVVEYEI